MLVSSDKISSTLIRRITHKPRNGEILVDTRGYAFLANVNSRSLYAVDRPSVVCRLSVTLVRPTQAVKIFGNISTAFGTLAIR